MKKKLSLLLLILCFIQSYATSEIIEVNSIHEIKNYIGPETLILFDIDNTLMEPTQTLGSDQWFQHTLKERRNNGMKREDALDLTLSQWMSIQSVTKVKVVEEGTAELIDHLQKEGFTLMGLTTRGLGLSTRTVFQLKSLDINLTTTAPTHEEIFFINHHGVLFRGGILFTAGTNKGMALAKFLHLIGKEPENIVFINDKWSNIREVEVVAEKYQVPFTGLRYSYTDEKVANFNPELAEMQFKEFGHIISDDEASARLLEAN
ncbi:MAG: DUF2608 domain-containing protein [Chlamydiota bacterium]|nr:DUF2608 domain-containing protein [Chlamydiota bacterium]